MMLLVSITFSLNFAEIKVMTLGNYDMIKASAVGDSTFGSTDSLSGDSIAFERNNAAVNPDNRNITDQTLAQKIKKGTIKIKKYGYRDKLISPNNQTKTINTTLEKDMAEVQFSSNVPAKVILNGKYIGSTPLKKDIQKIKHKISYEALGHRSIRESFEPLNDKVQIYKNLLTFLYSPI